MFQTLKNAWKTQELKTKLLFTLLIVVLYRLGASIPVPFVTSALSDSMLQSGGIALQLIAGDAFGQATLFALSVSPYITSSIIMQLLTIAIPALERLAKEGEEGKKKISMITRIVTVALALITAIGYTNLLVANSIVSFGSVNPTFAKIIMIACYCAGASLVMWLAEKINEFGIGNGISIILFANIVARFPQTFIGLYNMITTSKGAGQWISSIIWAVFILALFIVGYWLVVWFTDSERRIPVQYAKRVVGRKMYGGQSSNLPLKMNMAGVMPVIFATSIIALPSMIAGFFPNSDFASWIKNWFGPTSVLYIVILTALIVAFSYFYIMISFNPVEVANNIRGNGGAIPGIRPGKPTSDYIKKILNRITLMGSLFLIVVTVVPYIISAVCALFGITDFTSIAFTGTSLLIVVGVALETVRDLEAQLSMRNYKGFLD